MPFKFVRDKEGEPQVLGSTPQELAPNVLAQVNPGDMLHIWPQVQSREKYPRIRAYFFDNKLVGVSSSRDRETWEDDVEVNPAAIEDMTHTSDQKLFITVLYYETKGFPRVVGKIYWED